MLTWKIEKAYNDDKLYKEGDCLSTDQKPTEGIANGSLLIEMNTGTLYKFDEQNSVWRAIS